MNPWREKLRLFLRNGKGMFGLVLVLIFFASALFAPQLAPHDPFQLNIPARNSGPTIDYFVGTDQLGRDTFSRVLYGGRVALKIAAIGVSVSLLIGLVLGMIAGYGPRWLDNALLLFFDTVRSFPTIVMALAVVALTGPSLGMVMVIVIITSIPGYGRLARTSKPTITWDRRDDNDHHNHTETWSCQSNNSKCHNDGGKGTNCVKKQQQCVIEPPWSIACDHAQY